MLEQNKIECMHKPTFPSTLSQGDIRKIRSTDTIYAPLCNLGKTYNKRYLHSIGKSSALNERNQEAPILDLSWRKS